MKFFERARAWIEANADLGLDLVRAYLGIALMLKGLFFLWNRGELIGLMGETATLWFAPAIMAHYIILAHLVGGFLLAVGLFTRAAALVQIPILLGAVFWVTAPRMISLGMRADLEFAALTLFLLLIIFLYGAGRWSLDYYFSDRTKEIPAPTRKPA
ncbi:MAG: DoxX family protein [Limisphaerales bacterium]